MDVLDEDHGDQHEPPSTQPCTHKERRQWQENMTHDAVCIARVMAQYDLNGKTEMVVYDTDYHRAYLWRRRDDLGATTNLEGQSVHLTRTYEAPRRTQSTPPHKLATYPSQTTSSLLRAYVVSPDDKSTPWSRHVDYCWKKTQKGVTQAGTEPDQRSINLSIKVRKKYMDTFIEPGLPYPGLDEEPSKHLIRQPKHPAPILHLPKRYTRIQDLRPGTIIATSSLLQHGWRSILALGRVLGVNTDNTVSIRILTPVGHSDDFNTVTFKPAIVQKNKIIPDYTGLSLSPPLTKCERYDYLYNIEDFVYDDGEAVTLTCEGLALLYREVFDLIKSNLANDDDTMRLELANAQSMPDVTTNTDTALSPGTERGSTSYTTPSGPQPLMPKQDSTSYTELLDHKSNNEGDDKFVTHMEEQPVPRPLDHEPDAEVTQPMYHVGWEGKQYSFKHFAKTEQPTIGQHVLIAYGEDERKGRPNFLVGRVLTNSEETSRVHIMELDTSDDGRKGDRYVKAYFYEGRRLLINSWVPPGALPATFDAKFSDLYDLEQRIHLGYEHSMLLQDRTDTMIELLKDQVFLKAQPILNCNAATITPNPQSDETTTRGLWMACQDRASKDVELEKYLWGVKLERERTFHSWRQFERIEGRGRVTK